MGTESRLAYAIQSAAALSCAGGCSDSAEQPKPACSGETGQTMQALIGGAHQETFLAVPAPQIRAIVQIVGGRPLGEELCSGIFVARGWVLTASHCLQIQ